MTIQISTAGEPRLLDFWIHYELVVPSVFEINGIVITGIDPQSHTGAGTRIGDEERRLRSLVPAPAVRLLKRRSIPSPI